MIELLVVLVIIALIGGMASPSLLRWYDNRSIYQAEKTITGIISSLPLQASMSRAQLSFKNSEELGNFDFSFQFTPPLRVLDNGYCEDAYLTGVLGETRFEMSIFAPHCEVSKINVLAN